MGQREAAVAADPEPLLVVRIEPDRVPAVHAAAGGAVDGWLPPPNPPPPPPPPRPRGHERLAAVGRAIEGDVVVIRLLVVERADRDVVVVERPAVVAVHERPRFAAVLRPVDAGADLRHVAELGRVRIAAGYSASMCAITTFGLLRAMAMPILPVLPVGRPFVSFLKVLPPSVVLKRPPLDAAAVEAPRRPLALPEADVERVRIARIHARLDRAGPVRRSAGCWSASSTSCRRRSS